MKSLLCGTPGSPQKPGTVRALSQHTGRGSWEAGRHADVLQMFPSFPRAWQPLAWRLWLLQVLTGDSGRSPVQRCHSLSMSPSTALLTVLIWKSHAVRVEERMSNTPSILSPLFLSGKIHNLSRSSSSGTLPQQQLLTPVLSARR